MSRKTEVGGVKQGSIESIYRGNKCRATFREKFGKKAKCDQRAKKQEGKFEDRDQKKWEIGSI